MTICIKHISLLVLGLLSFSACKPKPEDPVVTSIAAFPHAEGGGAYVTGGRGGVVFHVTNLSDDANDPGSLRHALSVPGTRTIVFDVSGVIHLKQKLNIVDGAVTIAGQTAPGDGICIADYPVVVKCSNVIIRFLRFRMGDQGELGDEGGDALSIDGRSNIIIDHCSFSWSTDECVSCYGNTNFTLQYCFITESLRKAGHIKGSHGYGGIWGGSNASFHHNLIAHHDSRNPRFEHDYLKSSRKNHGPIDFVNNVVYNWGSNPAYGGEGVGEYHKINFVNNYYKPGPASKNKTRMVEPWTSCDNCSPLGKVVPPKIYLAGNYMFNSDAVTQDNWQGSSVRSSAVKASEYWTEGLTQLSNRQTAIDAYESVLAKAGCSLHRDAIDTRIVNEVKAGNYTYKGSNGSTNGLIDSQNDVGGWHKYQSSPAPADTDKDGLPDEWETEHGLNPNDVNDGKQTTLNAPYTNLEVYLNGLVEDCF
ncbi:MAG: pectate lyase [Paludibacteraceae bacterium]|nr:pectate lyase [Paludibacteraceae bacterium]